MANTIQDKLTYLSDTKDAIKQAIIGKGVEVTDTDTFRSYADKIKTIQSGGGGTVNLPDGIKFGYSKFTTVPDSFIPYLETQTDLSKMFDGCRSLQTVPLFTTSSVTDMNSMFHTCTSLESVPSLDTSSVTDIDYMFAYCENLQTIPLLNVSNVYGTDYMFWGCYSLTNLGGFTGLKTNLDLSSSTLLTIDSVMNVVNAAADMTSEPQTLTLHSDVFDKLTQDQIATATAKGWNIAAG